MTIEKDNLTYDADAWQARQAESVNKPYFAPIPCRAAGDGRLRQIHWRCLQVVAMHARTGQNGLGCTLGRRAIAEKAEISLRSAKTAIKDLLAWGYTSARPHPHDGRMQMLCIAFDNDADRAALSAKKTNPNHGDDDRKHAVTSCVGEPDHDVGSPRPEMRIGARSCHVGAHPGQDRCTRLHPEGIKGIRKGTPLQARATKVASYLPPHAELSRLERDMKCGKLGPYDVARRAEAIEDEAGTRSERGHADRIEFEAHTRAVTDPASSDYKIIERLRALRIEEEDAWRFLMDLPAATLAKLREAAARGLLTNDLLASELQDSTVEPLLRAAAGPSWR